MEVDESLILDQIKPFSSAKKTIGSLNKRIEMQKMYERNMAKKSKIIIELVNFLLKKQREVKFKKRTK